MKKKITFLRIMLLAVILLVVGSGSVWGQFNINSGGTDYTQNFNTLTSGTWTDNSTLSGWYAKTTATASITAYGANTGTTTTAGLYAFGIAGTNALTDRALGFAPTNGYTGASGTGKGFIGWRLKNNTGSAITSISVTWTGEQWRKDNTVDQTLKLFYQTGATLTDLTSGIWTDCSSVFTSPIKTSGALALDGNATVNRVANITTTITVSIPAGNEIILRWEDLNDSGNDHQLAIDDVTINATIAATSNDATLSAMTISAGTLSPSFAASTETYTATVTNATSTITVTPTRNQANATIQARVNSGGYSSVTSGSASGALALNVGSNTIDVLVTAQDGTTTKTYTTTLTREAALTAQTITFDALSAVTYGVSPFTVSATGGGSGNPVTFSSSDATVATCTGTNGATVTILKAGSCTINADQAGNGSYNSAPQVGQTLTVNAKTLTLPDAAVTSKIYTGTNAAVITGTLTGIINSDDVTLNGTGTFADVNVADGIAVTSTSTLGGTKTANYTLTQPTGLTGNITKASQTITGVSATATKYVGDVNYTFAATSTTSGTNALSYTSSDPAVASIDASTGLVQILTTGSTTIIVSQTGSANYNAATNATQTLTVNAAQSFLLNEDFDYTVGTDLTANGWNITSSNASPTVAVSASSITYAGYLSSGIGNETSLSSAGGQDVNKTLTSSKSSGTIYASFLVNVVSATTSGDYFFNFGQTSIGTTYRGRVFVKKDASNKLAFGIAQSTTPVNYSSFSYDMNTTYLIVVKFDIVSGATNDVSSIYVNPVLNSTIPSSGWIANTDASGTDLTEVGSIALRQGGNTSAAGLKIDGIRVSTNWSEIVGDLPTFTGTGEWSTSGNWNTGSAPASDAQVVINGDITINSSVSAGNITINNGKSLTVNAGKQLTVTTGIVNNGSLLLKSDAAGTATLIDSYSAPTITATVQQHVTAGRNWYMSAPINAAGFGALNKGSVVEWNEGTKHWDDVTSGTLTPGKGYIQVAASSTGTIDFTGTINSGPTTPVALTYNGVSQAGFNLVGNPYPSYLDWTLVNTGNTGANMTTGTMWYRTINLNSKSAWAPTTAYSLNTIVYNGTRFYKVTTAGTSAASGGPTGSGTSIADGSVVWNYEGSIYIFATVNSEGVPSPSTVSNLIPPMQAFWVKTSSGGGSFSFNNSMRSHNTGGTNALKAPKSTINDMKLLRLKVTNGSGVDESVIYSSANALNSFDKSDSPKWFNTSSNQPEIYTQVGNEKLAINAMNELSVGTEIPLGFFTEKANNFSINATEIKNFDSEMQIVLKDKLQNAEFDLTSSQAYQFSSDAMNDTNRFSIIFRSAGTTTGLTGSKLNTSTSVFVNANGELVVKTSAPLSANATVSIYNAIGQQIGLQTLTSSMSIANVARTAGVYWVKLSSDGEVVTRKVVVK